MHNSDNIFLQNTTLQVYKYISFLIFYQILFWLNVYPLAVLMFSCVWLCDPLYYSLPGSSVHRIFQAKILECVVIFSSRESSWTRDWICISCVSCITSNFLPAERSGKPAIYTRFQNIYSRFFQVNSTKFNDILVVRIKLNFVKSFAIPSAPSEVNFNVQWYVINWKEVS